MSYPGRPPNLPRTLSSKATTSSTFTVHSSSTNRSTTSSQPTTPGLHTSTPKPTASLQTLPPQLLHLILAQLPDLPSLSSLSLCSRPLHTSVRSAPSSLVSTILRNQIHPSVLGAALAAHAAGRIKVICVETTREFATKWLRWGSAGSAVAETMKRRWRLGDALPVSRLHFYVRSLARGLAGGCLAARGDGTVASEKETHRIERALYRFEIYNYLFRSKQSNYLHVVGDQMEGFFASWSGWENEQLAVVQEFLVGCIRPAFNDLAEHDVLWGSHGIEPCYDSSSEFIQAILARGLPAIHRIARAKSYHQRHKALYSAYPAYFTKFLYRGLEACQMASRNPVVEARKGVYPDGDIGPEKVWQWAQAGLGARGNRSRCYKQLLEVREWGYVFWDEKRLDERRIFDHPFQPKLEMDEDRRIDAMRDHKSQKSMRRRSDIHVAGGSGWWSAEDEGKVSWKPGKASPLDGQVSRTNCQVCFGEVICAPHRLHLNVPNNRTMATDDGISLNLDFNHLEALGPLSPNIDEFRLSRMPSHDSTLLGPQSPTSPTVGNFRLSGMPLTDSNRLDPNATPDCFRLSQMPLREMLRSSTTY